MYCDFYSVNDKSFIDNFIGTLCNEISLSADFGRSEKYETIYFGGGTPSLLRSGQLEKVLNRLHQTYSINTDAEITLEVNPGTVDKDKLIAFQSLGVNRLSVGIQSFSNRDLQMLTRIHTVEQCIQTISLAREIGFDSLSFDLIYAIPNQTTKYWEETLKKTLAFKPEHISAYCLIIEKGTPLEVKIKSKEIIPVAIELEVDMYLLTMEMLKETGYEHYEVSNYAKPGFRSKHNCNYWNHSNYIGFGPSAHSFWGTKRWWKVTELNSYIDQIGRNIVPIAGSEDLTKDQLCEDAVMLGVRTGELSLLAIKEKYGINFPKIDSSLIQELISNQLIVFDGQKIRLTNKGFLVCDEISERILALKNDK